VQSSEKRFQKDSSIVSRRIADEVILVPIRQRVGEVECLYTLNEVGAFIWELIDGERRVNEINERIVVEFAVSRETAETDLLTILQQFTEIAAIHEVTAYGT
jgi:hypothetical protein